jgi:hypothetical protein
MQHSGPAGLPALRKLPQPARQIRRLTPFVLTPAGWTKWLGVPVEAGVAAILRPTWPEIPIPVTTMFAARLDQIGGLRRRRCRDPRRAPVASPACRTARSPRCGRRCAAPGPPGLLRDRESGFRRLLPRALLACAMCRKASNACRLCCRALPSVGSSSTRRSAAAGCRRVAVAEVPVPRRCRR